MSVELRASACLWLLAACGDASWNGEVPVPDRAMFDTQVYTVLLRDCAFSECHGAPNRFFQVYGPGRSRLPGHPSDPDLVPREKEVSYQRAAAMLVSSVPGELWRAPLLTKPLEPAIGGASHEGVDAFGRNAFQSVTDPRYQLLLRWAYSASSAPASAAPTPVPPSATPVPPQPAPGGSVVPTASDVKAVP